MKTIVFDSGPIISLAMNGLLNILDPLQRKFGGEFLIPDGVREELIDRPIESKKFKFEALQVLRKIEVGTLVVEHTRATHEQAMELMNIANQIFIARDQPLKIVHFGEMETLSLAMYTNAEAVVIDERTTRLLLEDPERLIHILRHKLNTSIKVHHDQLTEFKKRTKGLKCLRSTEIALMAYELGLLDEYVLHIPEARKQLLQGLLWGIKLAGCTISQREIDTIVKMELR